MSGNGPRFIKKSAISASAWLGPLTEAGRLLETYRAQQAVLPPGIPVPPARTLTAGTTAAKPAAARIRLARQQAALGVRLAREGRLGPAIDRLRQAAELDPASASVQHDLGLALVRAERLDDALKAFGRAVYLNPNLASAHFHLATTFEILFREAEAQAAYEALLRLEPGLFDIHACLGKIHIANGRDDLAEACFRAAASVAAKAGSPRAGIYEAHAEKIRGRIAEAESLLRAVTASDPGCGEAWVALGQVLAEAGRSREAGEMFERGITLDPSMAAAWYQFATSTKFTSAHADHIARMEADLARADLVASQRRSVHFALGKAYDDLGDYGRAIRHLDDANRLRGSQRPMDRDLLARQTSHVIATTPSGFLDQCPGIGTDDPTPILIVGMPRSGTTLVEQILSCHPGVAAGGELGFWRERNRSGLQAFGPDAVPEDGRGLAEAYLGLLRSISSDAARVTDKMPFNFAHLGVIRQLFPCATIVHCRRHPVDTCLSNYATNFQVSYDFAADRGSLVAFYREYQRLMAHWRDVLPSDRFIEVDYEELVADPEPVTRALVATCGLDWNDSCLAPHRNPRAIATASLWQARQPIYRTSVERWRRYEPWLGELRDLLNEPEHETLANPSL